MLVERLWARFPARATLVNLATALALVPALLGVASMDATLVVDARYEVERYLASLPKGTHVEIYGGVHFLPRIPSQLVATRPGTEPAADRQAIAGVTEIVDPAMNPRPRAPAAIVLATELSSVSITDVAATHPFASMTSRDPVSRALFRDLRSGSLGYDRALRATCSLPWPLECRKLHDATAGEEWVYVRRPATATETP